MALRISARTPSLAFGAGALVATSQLGLAYGLGVVRLTRVFGAATRDQWPAQLAWVAWFAMISAAAGAWLAGRAAQRRGEQARPALHAALAAAAGIGALVVAPLAMQPARTAQVAGVDPVIVIGITAGLGALAGVFAGYAALASWTARLSLLTVGGAVWLMALVSVVPSLGVSDPLPAARLGVLDASFVPIPAAQRFALFTMPAIALVAGAALGWAARRRELPTLTIATAGLAGPALLTVAYLIAGPGEGAERYQTAPYWAATVASAAGVLGSVLAAVVRRAEDGGVTDSDDRGPGDARTGSFPAVPGRPADDAPTVAGGPGRSSGAPGRPGDRPRGPVGYPELSDDYTRHRDAPDGPIPPAPPGTDCTPAAAGRGPAPAGPAVAGAPVVPVPGDTPGSPSAGPPALSKLRRRRSTGAELGADRSRRPDGVPFASGPDRGPAGPGGTLDFFTPRSGEAPRRRPAPIPDDPFRPGQPADGGLGRRGPQPGPTAGPRSPQPRPTAGPRSPQPVQPPPPAPPPLAPPTPVRTTPPPFDGAPPKAAPGNGRVPQQRSGDRPGGGPSFGARPIGEQPYGTQPFTAFGPPPEQDDPRGRRQNNGPRGDVPKKDADYVDWVSGLGDR